MTESGPSLNPGTKIVRKKNILGIHRVPVLILPDNGYPAIFLHLANKFCRKMHNYTVRFPVKEEFLSFAVLRIRTTVVRIRIRLRGSDPDNFKL